MDAFYFERQARIALRCGEHEYGGLINAGNLEKEGGLYNAIVITLAHYFREAKGQVQTREKIEELLKDAEFFKTKKIVDDPELARYIFTEIRELRINAFNDDYKL